MKTKLLILPVLLCLSLLLFTACDARNLGSVKSITHPYVAQYECTEASLGGTDLLKDYDYIRIILDGKDGLDVEYKFKNGERRVLQGNYQFNDETGELTADIGILGYSFKQTVNIEDGRFTFSHPIGKNQLIMKFQSM